jgi:hypothetical protein
MADVDPWGVAVGAGGMLLLIWLAVRAWDWWTHG